MATGRHKIKRRVMKKNQADHPLMFKAVMLAAGLITGFLAARILFTVMETDSAAMEPYLRSGQRVLVSNLSSPEKGDVVAVDNPADSGKLLVLRIIAVEDDTIEIRSRVIYINGERFLPPWPVKMTSSAELPMKFCNRDNMPPLRLSRNEIFLMGDNYDNSYDSRYFGRVPRNSVTGKVIYSLNF